MDLETQNLDIETDKSASSNAVPALVGPQLDVNSTRYEYWGWVVLFSAFVCTGVVDGLLFSFGLSVLAMMETPTFLSWSSDGYYIPFFMYLLPGALLTGMHLYASEFRYSAFLLSKRMSKSENTALMVCFAVHCLLSFKSICAKVLLRFSIAYQVNIDGFTTKFAIYEFSYFFNFI
ncbi:unnamed protein product [Rodentolepis nana]|uniref:Uncharacterized protein n=1 Tax=Rodentolepis nana TaxID=102285 RepID=A0A0R3TRY4_RODNA|nr:unnamed protein product [Rodentolepis nana]